MRDTSACSALEVDNFMRYINLLTYLLTSRAKNRCGCLSVGRLTGKSKRAINMGSYNYLGFAQPTGPCADDAEQTTRQLGVGVSSSRHELGTRQIPLELSFPSTSPE